MFISKKRLLVVMVLAVIFTIGVYISKDRRDKVLGESDQDSGKVAGVVIPHHDLADEMIIEAIAYSKTDSAYEKIVIIGPNHYFPNSIFITTADTLRDYPISGQFVRDLSLYYDFVELDNQMLNNEHSVGLPIKYFSEVYPEAEYIPLAVSYYYNEEVIKELSKHLIQNLGENTLYVLAVDFAHNVGYDEGMKNNEESISALENFDSEKILTFDDYYLDSPLSAMLFLQIMEDINARNWKLIDSSHGSVIKGVPDLQGTSYVTGVFSKNE